MDPIRRILALIRGHIARFRLGAVSQKSDTYISTLMGDSYDPVGQLYFYKGRRGNFTHRLAMTTVPDLVVETAGCSFHETAQRVANFLQAGVKEVVILDGEHQAAHVFHHEAPPVVYSREKALQLAQLPRLSIDLRIIFKPERLQKPLTLLDPKVFQRLGDNYPVTLERDFNSPRLLETEWEIFQDLARYDAGDFHPTGIAGPLTLRVDGRIVDCSQPRRTSFKVTGSVEPDRLQFIKVRATGVLYIEIGGVYGDLREIEAWKKLGLILVCGYGIPRPSTRRLLHRLSSEFKLPVYVLTDNDTWGYYIFSVLKRGSLAPDRTTPELAIQELRFLGHRAQELRRMNLSRRYLISWQPYWELRLRAMAKYPCFRTQEWKTEFNNFRAQHGKYEGMALACGLNRKRKFSTQKIWSNYVDRYLMPKLQNGDWLT